MQKNYVYYFIPLVVMLVSFSESREINPREILQKAAQELKKHKSISYDALFRMKFFDGDDTGSTKSRCELIRVKDDSLLNGYIRIYSSKDTVEKIYDLKYLYIILHNKKHVIKFDVQKDGVFGLSWFGTDDVISSEFLEGTRFINALQRKCEVTYEGEEKINDRMCWIIKSQYPDKPEYSDISHQFYIDQKSFVLLRVITRIKFQGNYQYTELTISNFLFDRVNKKKFARINFPKDYKIDNYEERPEDYKLLDNRTNAPEFSGKIFSNNQQTKLSDYKGKLVLLDFWYMSCYPCIKALPHLEALHQKYQDKGLVVLGINSKDTDDKSKKRLPDFLKINKVTYPIILTQYRTDSLYLVKVYPTMYLINQKSEIVFSQVGLSENISDTLTKIIDKHINQ